MSKPIIEQRDKFNQRAGASGEQTNKTNKKDSHYSVKMSKTIKYTEVLKAEISESDFADLVAKAQASPAALLCLEAAASGGTSLRSFLADAAKICGSDFRPRNWM